MKQGLELKLGQHLAMTPQLQQAIRLLQLSTLDLQQEVQMMLDSNPLLDEEEAGELTSDVQENVVPTAEDRQLDLDAVENLPDELPVDSQWDDVFDLGGVGPSSGNSEEELPDYEARNSRAQSLQDYLRWQADLTSFTTEERSLAELIIDAIDDNGYLQASVEELAETAGQSPEDVAAILVQVQDFDPPGVGARTLAECLTLQLQQFAGEDLALSLARRIA